jgi:hypothetical protein
MKFNAKVIGLEKKSETLKPIVELNKELLKLEAELKELKVNKVCKISL